MNKRWISLLLAALMFCSLFSAFGTSSAADGWDWSIDDDGVLTVFGEGPTTNYRGNDNGRPWINVIDQITTVVVEDGITALGSDSFTSCPNLRKVTCGKDVSVLGMDAFAYCESLTEIVFLGPISEIGQGTVYGSWNLQKVTITGQTVNEFLQIANVKNYNDNYSYADFTVIGANGNEIIELDVVPMYGVLENYGDGTYFIVGGVNSYVAAYEKLVRDDNAHAELYLRVEITDETTGKGYVIPMYYFDDPGTEIYFDGSFLRLAVCEYGIVPNASHAYTIGLTFYDDDGNVVAEGVSEEGAFDSANDAFRANGPVIPDPIPHSYVNPDGSDPGGPDIPVAAGYIPAFRDVDLNGDRAISICDVTALLNLLANSAAVQTDINGDGAMTISDVTALMAILQAGIGDPFDMVDLTNAEEISDLGGYAEVLRVKTTGELLFSPNLNELRALVSYGAEYSDFIGYLRFTDVEAVYTYPSVKIEPVQSKGAWVDFFLQGNNIDCGFCPTAGVTYDIEFALARKSDPANAIFTARYTFTAAASYANSEYYYPTPAGPADPNKTFTLTYVAKGHGSIVGPAEQTLRVGELSQTVTAVPDEGYTFSAWSDGYTDPVRSGDTIRRNTTVTAIFVKEAGPDLPSVYVVTDDGQPILSKDYRTATISIVGTTTNAYDISNVTMQIKGRGNSSWNGTRDTSIYDSKNSYSIKLDKKAQLLGLGSAKSKKWVLSANKFDLSGLRNWVCWDLADRMGTISFTPDCAWVHLYVNGDYRGMYVLCEKIDAATGRVEVDDSATGNPDKGYLIEIDFRGDSDTDPYFYISGYGTNETVEFVIKSDIEGDQDIAFIKDYVQNCHNAILGGNRATIEQWVDLPSLVDMYIIEELSKDCDAGRASFYIAKDTGGKLFFTAPWDFDFGFGTYGPATNTSGLVSTGENCCKWFASLITRSWFRQLVMNRMTELAGAKDDMLEALRDKAEEIRTGADRNAEYWNLYGRNFHGYVSGQVSGRLHNWDEHIDFLVDWINERWDALYNEILYY